MKKPMPIFNKFSFVQLRVFSLLFAFPSLTCAGTDLVYGSGPGGYHSYTINVDTDLSREIQLNLDYFLSKATGVDTTREVGAGVTWYATELVSTNYRHSVANDGKIETKGNEGGLSLALDTLWRSELQTMVNLEYGVFKSKVANPQTPEASNFALTQKRSSFGFSQDIVSSFTVYGSHDRYSYDKDPNAALTDLLQNVPPNLRPIWLKKHPNLISRTLALLAFPDRTNTLGMTWRMNKALGLDLSSAKTTTRLGQEQKTTRLGADLQISNKVYIATAISRVSATAIVYPFTSVVVQPATSDTYSELSVGWGF